MSILAVYSEDIDFATWPSSYSLNTTNTYFRPTYSRCAMQCGTSGSPYALGIPFPTSEADPTPNPVTALWFSFYIYQTGNGANLPMCGIARSTGTNGTAGLYIGSGTVGGRLAIYSYSGSAATRLTEETTGVLLQNTLYRIDVQITNYDNASTGNCKVWVNGTAVNFSSGGTAGYTGNLASTSGVTNLDRFAIAGSNSGSYYWRISEVICASEDTSQMSLATLQPSSDVSTTNWVGSYADVDEIATNDADLMYSNTNNADATLGLSDLPAGTFTIKAVDVVARAMKSSDSAVGKLGLGIQSGGTVNSDAGQTLGTSYANYKRVMNNNPVTAAPFTQSEINALNLNLRALT